MNERVTKNDETFCPICRLITNNLRKYIVKCGKKDDYDKLSKINSKYQLLNSNI